MDAKYSVTFVLFRFKQKYQQTSPKTTNFNCLFWSEYILKTNAVLDYLPANSYAKFVGSHEHPVALIVLYDLVYSFYKNQVFTARG